MPDYSPTLESYAPSPASYPRNDEETLVADGRSLMSPSQMVEQKLMGMLQASPLLVSHMQRRPRPGPR